MKLNKLKSIVNQVMRDSSRTSHGYLIDPFYHVKPKIEIIIDLKRRIFTPDLIGDDIEKYYASIIDWFHEVLKKEEIPLEVIDKAILIISPNGKECIIEARGRKFTSKLNF